ncbi:MAG: hypothetical protein KF746_21320 [Chitinophagaceae bacterium]|nr:hypothetical protein [Chitinophagaceae bacterium]
MNEEEIQGLLLYLGSVGFQILPSLERQIRANIADDVLEFSPRYEVQMVEEKTEYVLHLLKDQQFQKYRLADYRVLHIDASGKRNSRNFSPTAQGICNVNLSYAIVSGRMDDLFEKLSYLNLEEFPGVHLVQNLEEKLSQNPDYFELKCSRNEPEGFIEFNIQVSKTDGWYSVDTYTAVLTPYPPIHHGIYNGINTSDLDDQMRSIDWHDDRELFIFQSDSEPEFKPKVGEIQEQIHRLSLDMVGADIADQLQLKYWTDATFFSDTLQQSAWDYMDSLQKRAENFPAELEAKAAFNLLCGRAILQDSYYLEAQDKPAWIQFDLTTRGSDGRYLSKVITSFSEDQLANIVQALPIPYEISRQIVLDLKRGDISYFALPDDKKIFLEANPEQQTVNVYSQDMRPIQVNFHFDPDWQPLQKIENNKMELQRKFRQNIIHAEYPPGHSNRFRRNR